VLILNEAHLLAVRGEFAGHYNAARPRQGIAQRAPEEDPDGQVTTVIDLESVRIRRRPVLGGLTSEYQVAA
jgi:putative transposase